MTAPLDARVTDPLHELPYRARRALVHAPWGRCLDGLLDELADEESVRAISCAISSASGRGVLALTSSRLVFCCTRFGAQSWTLEEIAEVDGRPGRFTLAPAIFMHVADRRLVFALGSGRAAGPRFVQAVRAAVAEAHRPDRAAA
jgi:hypothetical protein